MLRVAETLLKICCEKGWFWRIIGTYCGTVLDDQTEEFSSDFLQALTSISDVYCVKISDFLELGKGLIRSVLYTRAGSVSGRKQSRFVHCFVWPNGWICFWFFPDHDFNIWCSYCKNFRFFGVRKGADSISSLCLRRQWFWRRTQQIRLLFCTTKRTNLALIFSRSQLQYLKFLL